MRVTFHTQHLLLKEHSHEIIVANSADDVQPMSCVLLPFGVPHCQRKAKITKDVDLKPVSQPKAIKLLNFRSKFGGEQKKENIKPQMAKQAKILTLYLFFQIKSF